jgi:hypothetical protein
MGNEVNQSTPHTTVSAMITAIGDSCTFIHVLQAPLEVHSLVK